MYPKGDGWVSEWVNFILLSGYPYQENVLIGKFIKIPKLVGWKDFCTNMNRYGVWDSILIFQLFTRGWDFNYPSLCWLSKSFFSTIFVVVKILGAYLTLYKKKCLKNETCCWVNCVNRFLIALKDNVDLLSLYADAIWSSES